jgi:hypothetical protein|tara:strand:- start:499 stop:765 length:267 start_codon:yes stop_codon:yes gene_type:complete
VLEFRATTQDAHLCAVKEATAYTPEFECCPPVKYFHPPPATDVEEVSRKRTRRQIVMRGVVLPRYELVEYGVDLRVLLTSIDACDGKE